MPLPQDIMQYLHRHFSGDAAAEAEALLTSAKIHDGTPASPRLLRCALAGSAGDLAKLRRLVQQMTEDERDVIVTGEYDTSGRDWVRVRDLSQPFPNE